MATTGNHPVNDPTKEDAAPEMQKIKYLVFDHNNIRYHVRNEALWWPGKLFAKRRQESAADPGGSIFASRCCRRYANLVRLWSPAPWWQNGSQYQPQHSMDRIHW
jgi:hypothetical protein